MPAEQSGRQRPAFRFDDDGARRRRESGTDRGNAPGAHQHVGILERTSRSRVHARAADQQVLRGGRAGARAAAATAMQPRLFTARNPNAA